MLVMGNMMARVTMGVVLGALGFGIMLLAIYQSTNARYLNDPRVRAIWRAEWRDRLRARHIALPAGQEDAVLDDIATSWYRANPAVLSAAGILPILAIAWWDILRLPIAITYLLASGSILLVIGLTGVTYSIGFRHLRRAGGAGGYADLRPRQTRDYRSPIFAWIGVLTLVIGSGVLVALNGVMQISLSIPGVRFGVSAWWLLGLAGCAWGVGGGGAAFVRHIATYPRLWITHDAPTSRAVDDAFRLRVIARLTSVTNLATAYLWATVANLLVQARVGIFFSTLLAYAVSLFWTLAGINFVLGLLAAIRTERGLVWRRSVTSAPTVREGAAEA